MPEKLQFNKIASLGRTFEEYSKMFSLNENALKNNQVLDVASGASSFCAEANEKRINVTATDLIYDLSYKEIKNKFDNELTEVVKQLPGISHLYKWDLYKDNEDLRRQRQESFDIFFEDFKTNRKRYIFVDYPSNDFLDNQFKITLVSHFLFMWDDRLSFDFHKKTLLELARITSEEIRLFPIVNMSGKRSEYIDRLISYLNSQQLFAHIERVGYEFIKGGNQMMVIKTNSVKK
jgi:hypothetical protein